MKIDYMPFRCQPVGTSTYRIVEYPDAGGRLSKSFPAPSDRDAVVRAYDVAGKGLIEVWRGGQLLQRVRKNSET